MGELYDMDIKGRPLAYTPFCDNNKDMDGYRFWRQVDTLQYHPFLCLVHGSVKHAIEMLIDLCPTLLANVVPYFLLNRVSGKII